jgi:transcriptional regulator with XRE-family HTH domain
VADQEIQPSETVEVKRRRLRIALRDARNESEMTQKAAAERLSWSTSKIVRIEQGAVPVTPIDVRAMLSLYGVTDAEHVESLAALAIEARESKGFKEYADVFSPDAVELFGSEQSAKTIYKYEPTVVPGILQTQEYARALLLGVGNSQERAARKLAARLQRQRMLENNVRPELNFIIGEAALLRPIGGPDVMLEQLEALRQFSREKDINLYILPFSAGPHRALGNAFTILQFSNPANPDVLYLENAGGVSISRNRPEDVDSYLDIFVELETMADRAGEFETLLDQMTGERYGKASS